MQGDLKPDDIVYMRLRVCSTLNETTAGRECVMVEPVSKGGRIVEGAWIYTAPKEWLIPMSEMKRLLERRA